MNEIFLVKVRDPVLRNLTDQSRNGRISRDDELVNKIKLHKDRFKQNAI